MSWSFARILGLAGVGGQHLAGLVRSHPGRSNRNGRIQLPSKEWFATNLQQVIDSLELESEIDPLEEGYLVVGRGASLDAVEADASEGTGIVLINPLPETMEAAIAGQSSVTVAAGDPLILNLARSKGCSVWTLHRREFPLSDSSLPTSSPGISYSLRKIYGQEDDDDLSILRIDHFLGPLPIVAMALESRGLLRGIVGWDQYLSGVSTAHGPFYRFSVLTPKGNFYRYTSPNTEKVNEVTGVNPKESPNRRNIRSRIKGVLTWAPHSKDSVDMRHAIRNLVNFWICGLMIKDSYRIEGRILSVVTKEDWWSKILFDSHVPDKCG